jgi:hypothetical protein
MQIGMMQTSTMSNGFLDTELHSSKIEINKIGFLSVSRGFTASR